MKTFKNLTDEETKKIDKFIINNASFKEIFIITWWSMFKIKKLNTLFENILIGKNWIASFSDAQNLK